MLAGSLRREAKSSCMQLETRLFSPLQWCLLVSVKVSSKSSLEKSVVLLLLLNLFCIRLLAWARGGR